MVRKRIISWNVNGIRSVHRKGKLLEFLENDKPDVLCIQETKAQEEQLSTEITDIPGYTAHFCSAKRKGYSGVALYTREKPQDIRCGLGIQKFDSEGRTIVADYGDFVLMNIYYPNGKMSPERLAYKMEFYDAFLDYANDLKAQGRMVLACGDVNTAHTEIDLARPKANAKISGFLPQERAWIDKFLSQGYLDTFRILEPGPEHYSWWSMRANSRARNVGWRLDYFFVNIEFREKVKEAFILPEVLGSDHCPVGVELEF